jgi:hypothetical protein
MASKKVVIRVVLQQCIENRAVKNVLSLAQSGRKMTKELAEQIIQDVNNSAGHKQIIIIGLGGNDLRPKGVLAGHNVQQLVQLHKKIVAHVEATEGYGITFTLQSYVIFVVIHGRQIFFRGGGANSLKNPFLMDHFFSRWGGGGLWKLRPNRSSGTFRSFHPTWGGPSSSQWASKRGHRVFLSGIRLS